MTLIDKIVHYIFLLLFGPVLKLAYLSSEVEKKVTLFCIISILVLLTHMLICSLLFLCEHSFTFQFSALMPKISKENLPNIPYLLIYSVAHPSPTSFADTCSQFSNRKETSVNRDNPPWALLAGRRNIKYFLHSKDKI